MEKLQLQFKTIEKAINYEPNETEFLKCISCKNVWKTTTPCNNPFIPYYRQCPVCNYLLNEHDINNNDNAKAKKTTNSVKK